VDDFGEQGGYAQEGQRPRVQLDESLDEDVAELVEEVEDAP